MQTMNFNDKSKEELLQELQNLQNENITLRRAYEKDITERRLAEEAVQKINKKFEAMISASPDGIGIISLDGKLLFASAKLAKMYGYSADQTKDFIGKPAIDFVDPSDHEKLIENIRKLYDGVRDHNITEYLAIKKDNSRFFLEVNSTLLFDSDGNPESILLIERDITERKRKEEELQQSSQKWDALISASPDGIGMISIDGKIQLISDKLVAMHGYPVENKEKLYYGRSIFDFIDPSSHRLLIDNTRKLLTGKKDDKATEYLALKNDGSTFNIDVKTSVLKDIYGNPKSILYVERDITERKLAERELQQSNEKLEAIISASPDGIGMISLDGKMQLMSDKLMEIYGYPLEERDEILKRNAFEFIDQSSHAILKQNIGKLIAGNKDIELTEYMAVKKDGSRFYIDVNSTILHDTEGKPVSVLFVERDITERKKVEEEIREKNRELAELNATKDKFFSIIAHDLKSPFQGLLGLAQILSAEFSALSEDEKISSINTIRDMSNNTYKLLENLLDWARLQTGQMNLNLENFNLNEVLCQTLSLVKQTAQNKRIEFTCDIENTIFVNADRNMLSTIVRNLCSNSIKFTNPGGRIKLAAEKSVGFVQVSVADTGIGIEPESLEELFKIDKNISRKGTANEEGTGLGLLLCKEMIEKHGSKISVESEVGKGSTFSFKIHALA